VPSCSGQAVEAECVVLGLLDPESEVTAVLRNVGNYSSIVTVSYLYTRRLESHHTAERTSNVTVFHPGIVQGWQIPGIK
jgi:hypothetical protein